MAAAIASSRCTNGIQISRQHARPARRTSQRVQAVTTTERLTASLSGAAAAALLLVSPASAVPQMVHPVAEIAEAKDGNVQPKTDDFRDLGTPLAASRYTGQLSGDEQTVQTQRKQLLDDQAKGGLNNGQGTKTNTLLDPYGLPSNKNNRPGGLGK
eukprot:jgi/Astpho2/3028/Aster-03337